MITIEQAIANLQQVCDNFVGKKQDHIALEQSMNAIKEAINKSVAESEKPKE